MEQLTKIQEQKATRFYNVAQFQDYLISQGASYEDPEFKLYSENCKSYGCEAFGHVGLEKYYNADEVDYLIRKDQGYEFMNLVKENVPITISTKDFS